MSGVIPRLRLHALVTWDRQSVTLFTSNHTLLHWREITDLLIGDSTIPEVCMLLNLRRFLESSEIAG
jgi:hypothetical protein